MADPTFVPVFGDWHGNNRHAVTVIDMARRQHADEGELTMLHVGDFGVWPGSRGVRFLDDVQAALERADARLWFVDGNHEDFTQLLASFGEPGDCRLRERITWLPRNTRWWWHGRSWLAMGGATSVDRALRTAHRDWWPEEAITEGQTRRAMEDGAADVMVTHDAPSLVPMQFGLWPASWDVADRARADAHRERLQAIVDVVKPGWMFHGHYHRAHDLQVEMPHGVVRVVGLNMDGEPGNFRIVDARTMEMLPSAVDVA